MATPGGTGDSWPFLPLPFPLEPFDEWTLTPELTVLAPTEVGVDDVEEEELLLLVSVDPARLILTLSPRPEPEEEPEAGACEGPVNLGEPGRDGLKDDEVNVVSAGAVVPFIDDCWPDDEDIVSGPWARRLLRGEPP